MRHEHCQVETEVKGIREVITQYVLIHCPLRKHTSFPQGDYKGIMVVVTPCRSDRSTLGLLPYSHLNDGRLHVILIRSCSVLQYLRFLASIPQRGNSIARCFRRLRGISGHLPHPSLDLVDNEPCQHHALIFVGFCLEARGPQSFSKQFAWYTSAQSVQCCEVLLKQSATPFPFPSMLFGMTCHSTYRCSARCIPICGHN